MNTTREKLFSVLAELSQHCPEVRVGQLLSNLATLARGPQVESIWDVEDDELLAAAKRQLATFEARQASIGQ